MESKGPIIGYWQIHGLGELAKLIMEFSGKPYQMQYFKNGPPPEFCPGSWLKVRETLGLDFPNLPYVIDGDLKISESMNVYLYLSEKYAPELLGKSPASKAKILEGFFVIRCIKDALTAGCYAADTSKAKESIESQAKKIKLIEDKLADRD